MRKRSQHDEQFVSKVLAVAAYVLETRAKKSRMADFTRIDDIDDPATVSIVSQVVVQNDAVAVEPLDQELGCSTLSPDAVLRDA
jgi:hypothetical protein